MHRRALRTLAMVLLVAVAVASAALLTPAAGSSVLASPEPPPAGTVDTDGADELPAPPVTTPPIADNEFLPENANLSDCLGFVQRPGCGSEARGGLQQTLIFVAIAVGLAIIFWRVSVGVRRNRRASVES